MCLDCLQKTKRTSEATIKLDQAIDALTVMELNNMEPSNAFREYLEDSRREHRHAIEDLERHRAIHAHA